MGCYQEMQEIISPLSEKICINALSISIIHAGYNMHILLRPVHHRKDKNLLPAPALDLTVFCIFHGLYLM